MQKELKFFSMNGAQCHTAKLIKDYLDFCEVDYLKDWPGNPSDINPTNNLWGIIKSELSNHDISSLPKLEAKLQDVWENLDPETLQNLALSIPRCLKAVIVAKGGLTRY